jgi:hypothetical protein
MMVAATKRLRSELLGQARTRVGSVEKHMCRNLILVVLVGLGLAVSGCGGGGPEVVPIEGIATHNGQPVPNIRIYFMPTDGRPSWAITDDRGHFVLDYDPEHKGAKVGTHKVWIVDESRNIDPTIAMSGGPRPKRAPAIADIVTKYGSRETSPLEVEVKKANRNFELKLD